MSAMHAPRSLTLARSARITALAVPAAISLALLAGTAAVANVGLTRVSHDIYTDSQAQHRTEVEPDTFQAGATIVSAFQVGRVFGGGASNIGWSTSTNGGASWGPARSPGGNHIGLGGQPLVLPNGDVVVPYLSIGRQIRSFRSTNGGASWGSSVLVSSVEQSRVRGGLRAPDLPSAAVDAAGTVYVAWSDCRFRAGCHSNDIVIAKSANGTTWAAPVRVPIDATSSTADHFIPGLDVDRSTSGAHARIGLTYYSYPTAACGSSACQLDAGFISSVNGGASWSAPTRLAGPMKLSWLANTSQGRMFGDYISTSVLPGGNAYPVISVAKAPSGATFNQAMYTPTGGLAITGGGRAASAAHAYHVTRGAGGPTVPLTVR